MTGLRIGLVCPYSFQTHGGVQHHVRGLARQLAYRGHRPHILAPGPETEPVPGVDFTSAGPALPVPYNGSVARVNFGPVTAARVAAWLHRGAFDVLHIHEPITPSIALLALAAARVPVVATFHTATPRSRTMQLAGRTLGGLIGRIDARIAVSESARRVVVQHLGHDAVVVPNGFEAAAFGVDAAAGAGGAGGADGADGADVGSEPRTGPTGDTASRFRGGDRPRITFLGRLDEPRKGLRVLLAALPAIRAARPDLEVVVAGQGTSVLPPGIVTPGRLSERDKVRLLARTDVFVAPHLARESFGIVLLEALASGAAVVATDLPAFTDLLASLGGSAARTVPAGDPAALADGVLAALAAGPPAAADPGRPGHPGESGIPGTPGRPGSPALGRYDWTVVTPEIELVYRGALAGGRARRAGPPRARVQQTWAALDAALHHRARAVLTARPGPEHVRLQHHAAQALRPDLPQADRERAESALSHALSLVCSPLPTPAGAAAAEAHDPDRLPAVVARRMHNDAVARLRGRRGTAGPDLRPFEMAE